MIIRTNSRTLFAIAYGILQNREEIEDVVQDSLVKAWKTRWRVRDPEKFPAWLGTIARHRARHADGFGDDLWKEEVAGDLVAPDGHHGHGVDKAQRRAGDQHQG